MAPKPPSSDDPTLGRQELGRTGESEPGKPGAVDPHAAPPSADETENDGQDEEIELDDDEEDEDLVVFTAREAAGAFATIYGFVKPYFGNYKKLIAFVSFGVI